MKPSQMFPGGVILQQDVTKPGAPAADAGLDRADRDAGDPGDLVVGATVDVGEEDGQPLVLGEEGEGPLQDG